MALLVVSAVCVVGFGAAGPGCAPRPPGPEGEAPLEGETPPAEGENAAREGEAPLNEGEPHPEGALPAEGESIPAEGAADTVLPPGDCTYEVVHAYAHDPDAFTQGLAYDRGRLYEGTGLHGESELRLVELETGAVLQRASLDRTYFGEGISVLGERIVQLTWRQGLGFVYDRSTLVPYDEFTYDTEGWGLTHDGTRLIMSDGTATLYFMDPDSFAVLSTVSVHQNGAPVTRLNELEYVEGEVLANVWRTDKIVRIDPATGAVIAWIHLDGLAREANVTARDAVLNGIAFDSEGKRLFVTGKRWPKLFEIRLRRRTN